MNIKQLLLIIVGVVVFTSIWLFSMFVALGLLCGFGFGVWLHNWFIGFFDKMQNDIYLSQKANIDKRKKELEIELNKLNKDN
jgi:uncharacterized membrane protein